MSTVRSTLVAAGAGAAILATVAVSASAATSTPTATASSGSAVVTSGDTARYGGAGRWFQGLTDEQRACLQDAGITRPVWPLDVSDRVALRGRVRAAASACDITVPDPTRRERMAQAWVALSDEQRSCLTDTGLTRPVGRLSDADRATLRAQVVAAAKSCGVTLPKPPAGLGGPTSATPGS